MRSPPAVLETGTRLGKHGGADRTPAATQKHNLRCGYGSNASPWAERPRASGECRMRKSLSSPRASPAVLALILVLAAAGPSPRESKAFARPRFRVASI